MFSFSVRGMKWVYGFENAVFEYDCPEYDHYCAILNATGYGGNLYTCGFSTDGFGKDEITENMIFYLLLRLWRPWRLSLQEYWQWLRWF